MKKTSAKKVQQAKTSEENKTEKAGKPEIEVKKTDKKQIIVGLIILVVALLLLFFSFYKGAEKPLFTAKSDKPVVEEIDKNQPKPAKMVEQKAENVVFVFTAITPNPLHYKLYYTTSNDMPLDEEHTVSFEGKAGKNTYSINIPAEKISRFRLSFGEDVGKMTLRDIYLTGSQTEDLNNLYHYWFYQIIDVDNQGDGSFSFEIIDYNASMEYRLPLLKE